MLYINLYLFIKMVVISNIIWIDSNVDNEENRGYLKDLQSYNYFKIKCFKNIDEAINIIKKIEFEETYIILSGRLYIKFIEKFKENLKDVYIIPKIIIFTENKDKFIEYNKEYSNILNHPFYNLGGIKTSFDEIKKFILNPINKKILNRDDEGQLTFEYIDSKEKLGLPLLYKSLIEVTPNDKIDIFTKNIFEKYSKDSISIKNLLNSIKDIPNIPIELLSKYYARLYTAEAEKNKSFYSEINKELRENKTQNYLPYIKALYEGIKVKSLSLSSNNILYRGTNLLKKEIEIIKKYLKKKLKDLPGAIVFSRAFLSFSKEKKIAENFLKNNNNNKDLCKVLFILDKDENIDYNLGTHADIEKISFYPNEREVLFFPFSTFEIKEIKEEKINNENIYFIKLLYLGKYLKELENDKTYIQNEKKIPDSAFKKQIIESGLIKSNEITNNKQLIQKFKEYKNNINSNKNYIIGEIKIKEEDVYTKIRIINTYEEVKRNDKWDNGSENEKQIKENCEIKIEEQIIKFSYYYEFKKSGNYKIEYLFKKNLSNTNYMFFGCSSLTNLNLSNFNTQNVTHMSSMFYNCSSLTNLN